MFTPPPGMPPRTTCRPLRPAASRLAWAHLRCRHRPAGAGDSDTTFATGMLRRPRPPRTQPSPRPLRKGQSRSRPAWRPIAGMMPGAADMLNGQLGDIDKLIMLSKLPSSTRSACRSCWNAWRRPRSAASRTSARPIAVELPSADVCACGCTAPAGPAPMGAIAGGGLPNAPRAIAGGGVVQRMLLKQMMGQAGGMV